MVQMNINKASLLGSVLSKSLLQPVPDPNSNQQCENFKKFNENIAHGSLKWNTMFSTFGSHNNKQADGRECTIFLHHIMDEHITDRN